MRKHTSLSTSKSIAEPMAEMNMTPLIDVMLVLIIMLIITIPRQNHSTSLTLPGAALSVAQPQVVNIEVDFDGTILWNGEVMLSRSELSGKLAAAAKAAEPSEVHIRPNKLAPYSAVAAVMAATQRAGVLNMGVVGNEQFM
jgi:biopolymer transport protein ExbD